MNIRKMNKGAGGVAGPFFATSGFDLDATRFYFPHPLTNGDVKFTDDSDYSMGTAFTSYKKGNVGALETSPMWVESWT